MLNKISRNLGIIIALIFVAVSLAKVLATSKFMEGLDNSYNRLAKEDTNEYLLAKLRSIQNMEYNMSYLEVNEEYSGDEGPEIADIKDKKKVLMEGIINTEKTYNIDYKFYKKIFN